MKINLRQNIALLPVRRGRKFRSVKNDASSDPKILNASSIFECALAGLARFNFLFPLGEKSPRYRVFSPDLHEPLWSVWDSVEKKTVAKGPDAAAAVNEAMFAGRRVPGALTEESSASLEESENNSRLPLD